MNAVKIILPKKQITMIELKIKDSRILRSLNLYLLFIGSRISLLLTKNRTTKKKDIPTKFKFSINNYSIIYKKLIVHNMHFYIK